MSERIDNMSFGDAASFLGREPTVRRDDRIEVGPNVASLTWNEVYQLLKRQAEMQREHTLGLVKEKLAEKLTEEFLGGV